MATVSIALCFSFIIRTSFRSRKLAASGNGQFFASFEKND
jgi:hypothetical protein